MLIYPVDSAIHSAAFEQPGPEFKLYTRKNYTTFRYNKVPSAANKGTVQKNAEISFKIRLANSFLSL